MALALAGVVDRRAMAGDAPEDISLQELREALGAADPGERAEAVRALADNGDPADAARIAALLEDRATYVPRFEVDETVGPRQVRYDALEAVAQLGPEPYAALFDRALEEDDPEARFRAPHGASVAALLRAVEREPNDAIRYAIVQALLRRGGHTEVALRALDGLTTSSMSFVALLSRKLAARLREAPAALNSDD